MGLKTALEGQESVVSYLPLSHIAAQMIDIWLPIAFGVQTFFAQPDALKVSFIQGVQVAFGRLSFRRVPTPAVLRGRLDSG